MTELHWTEVDGVTTVWTDAREPLLAGLLFRTGRVDETLLTAGQTHLLEHLALSTVADVVPNQTGSVTGTATSFVASGAPELIVAFASGICQALTTLPGERLEAEKQILEAESATRPYDFAANLLSSRYGAAGYGLLGFTEFGFRVATLEQLRVLAAERFTRQNAVLWLSGPPPAGLRLPLPEGRKRPIPALVPAVSALPGWFVDDDFGGVAVAATVPRTSAATVFCTLVSRILLDRLRTRQAVSYAPRVTYDPLDARTAHLVLCADSDRERRAELTEEFYATFEEFARFSEADIDAARKEIIDQWTGASAPPPAELALHEVQRAATGWLVGRDFEPIETLAAELTEVDVPDVEAFGRSYQDEALFALPSGVTIQALMGSAVLFGADQPVQGRVAMPIDAPVRRDRLVYGPEGVSLCFPDGSHNTVRYSDLAGSMVYDDGSVALIGARGGGLVIVPAIWRNGARVVDEIHTHIPAHLLLGERLRLPGTTPTPTTNRWQRARARLRHPRG